MSFLRLLSLNASGLYSFGHCDAIPLDKQGVVSLTGLNRDRMDDSNGAGKSSIMEAVAKILFGQDSKGGSDTEVVNSVWNHGCFGIVYFAVDDQRYYRVMMVRDWKQEPPEDLAPSEILDRHDKYTGTDIFFEEYRNNYWVDIRSKSMKDTRLAIRQTVGLSYEQFCAIAYLGQQRGLRFVDGKHNDRSQIFSDIQDLSVWDRASKHAASQGSAITQQLDQLTTQIETTKRNLVLQQSANTSPAALATLGLDISTKNGQIDQLKKWVELNSAACAQIKAQMEEVKNKIDTHRNHMATLEADLRTIQNDYSPMAPLDAAEQLKMATLPGVEKLNTVYLAGIHKGDLAEKARQALYQAENLIANTCDHCGAVITEQTRAQHVADLRQAFDVAREEAKQFTRLVDLARDSLKRDTDAVAIEFMERKNVLRAESAAKQAKLGLEIADINGRARELSKQKQQLETAHSECNTNSTQVNQQIRALEHAVINAQAQIQAMQAALSIIQQLQTQIDTAEASIKQLTVDRDYWNALAKHFGNTGIKAYKFGALIDTLEQLVRKYTNKLTNDAVQVSFSPFREKANAKTDADIVADFQILVKEGPKEDVPIKLYSGAERQQIVVAIIIALAKLASLQGSGTNVLFLDEIFGMLHGNGKLAMVELIGELRSSNVGTMLIVTHDPEVQKIMDCDQIWTVIKQNHISTLVRS